MDEPILTLAGATPQIAPGQRIQVPVDVRNPGQNLETYRLDVVGLDRSWWEVHPPRLDVEPGYTGRAVVVLRAPTVLAEDPDAGPFPFGVRATASIDAIDSLERRHAAGRAVVEADLAVGPMPPLEAELRPVTARAHWFAPYRIVLRNHELAPMQVYLSTFNRRDGVRVRIRHRELVVPASGQVRTRVRVRDRGPAWFAGPSPRTFEVLAESISFGETGTRRTVMGGVLLQTPVLSRTLVRLLAVLVLLGAIVYGVHWRDGAATGARVADVAPDAPVGLSVARPSAGMVRLGWTASDRASAYRVQQVSPDGTMLGQVETAGPATSYGVTVDPAISKLCYRIVAVHDRLSSEPGKTACTP